MTIKTGNGQTVEISCEGNLKPQAISVASDGTVTLKMGEETTPVTSANVAEADSRDETTDSLETENPVLYTGEEPETDVKSDSLASDSLSTSAAIAAVANAVVEELSPEYAQFNKEHEGTHPGTEKELVKRIAKNYVDEDIVEAADLLTQLFGSIRFTKDSTFVPKYAMRKAKPEWRAYDIVELSGNLGKDISSVSDDMATRITEKDYGDDTENEKKYGGGIKYSRTYMRGTIEDGEWKPNPLGFAVSWGGLFSYAYEQDAGSFVNAMGKVGVQIGHDICFGVDALCGVGIVPYKTFITNDINHNTVSKSAWCFKYGVEGWGSLNFSKDTYTAIYGRYITSIRPATGKYELSKGWNVLYEDFDPSYPEMVAGIKSEEYYISMMIAWYFATALAKQYDTVLPFIEDQLGLVVGVALVQQVVVDLGLVLAVVLDVVFGQAELARDLTDVARSCFLCNFDVALESHSNHNLSNKI